MKDISFIANSGIQFYTAKVKLGDKSDAIEVNQDFAEIKITEDNKLKVYLHPVYYYSKTNQRILKEKINPDAEEEDGSINEDKIKPQHIYPVPDNQINTIGAREAVECYENQWLPLPYYRKETNCDDVYESPKSWARFLISPISDKAGKSKNDEYTHYLVLAFDTRTEESDDPEDWDMPKLVPGDSFTYLCKNETFWYIAQIKEGEIKSIFEEAPANYKDGDFQYKHLQTYITLLETLEKAIWQTVSADGQSGIEEEFKGYPEVSLHRGGKNEEPVEVALVLDIGNSRTTGLLAETYMQGAPFDITKVVPLQIRDLERPYKVYNEPFDMRVVFSKPPFQKEEEHTDTIPPFFWPGITRVGAEANRLSTLMANNLTNSVLSSPKRYLWDNRKQLFPWYFLKEDNGKNAETAFDQHLTKHFTEEGDLIEKKEQEIETIPNAKKPTPAFDRAYYSRSSLMTFALIEIIWQAVIQANSISFRSNSSRTYTPRKLSRIIITCPTAMVQTERMILRNHADSAVKALKKIFGETEVLAEDLQIIPPIEIFRVEKDRRDDWGYDEATASQLAFIYSEINDRFMGRPELYFDKMGTYRKNIKEEERKSVIVANVDIGGGTTDLMIAAYQNDIQSPSSVIPQPLFWEGFNIAGDNILKRIIERIVIGQIEEKAKELGANSDKIKETRITLFGELSGLEKADEYRIMKKHITNQVLVPIANGILEHAAEYQPPEDRDFDTFFYNIHRPNKRIIQYINDKYRETGADNFSIEKVSWHLDSNKTNKATKEVIQDVLALMASIIKQYKCDYVLLTGRPSRLPIIRESFLELLPVTPDRIIQLGKYWIGTWYPFIKGSGYIKDAKTTVSVGALIAYVGGNLGALGGFSIDPSELKKIESTANFIGEYAHGKIQPLKDKNQEDVILERSRNSLTLHLTDRVVLGMRQMEHPDWIGTKMYELSIDEKARAEHKANLPFKVELQRDPKNIENLSIKSVYNKRNNRVSNEVLSLQLKTMEDEYGYWLDTGIFNVDKIG